jgi:hypothetical protein
VSAVLWSLSSRRAGRYTASMMQEPWIRVLSFILFLLSILALPDDCLAKKKSSVSATAASTAAASTGEVSTATDGSTVLDKTATIKCVFQSIFLI